MWDQRSYVVICYFNWWHSLNSMVCTETSDRMTTMNEFWRKRLWYISNYFPEATGKRNAEASEQLVPIQEWTRDLGVSWNANHSTTTFCEQWYTIFTYFHDKRPNGITTLDNCIKGQVALQGYKGLTSPSEPHYRKQKYLELFYRLFIYIIISKHYLV